MNDPRRDLPSVERLLADPAVAPLLAQAPRAAVADATRAAVAAARRSRDQAPREWALEIRERLDLRESGTLRPVINATGVVLHTNLGRAPLAARAVAAMLAVARGYSSLEFDLPAGVRGSRHDHVRERLARLTDAKDALVVNNAAGALVLALNECARGAAVAISRGELIEIGGSFRIPDIIARSGAALMEVGTTNRTHLADYRAALDGGARCILSVHRSNFSQHGFVATPALGDLVALAGEHGVPLIRDAGTGLLLDLAPQGIDAGPTVGHAVAAGADLVISSGDKLLGGPQAGLIVGRRALVEACRRNPLARALRADKLTLAALDATLALYADPEVALREVPVLRMLTDRADVLERRAARLAALLPAAAAAEVRPTLSAVGGGTAPDVALPSVAVILPAHGTARLLLALRMGEPAVVAVAREGAVWMDVRTVADDDVPALAMAVMAALDVGT